MPTQNKASLTPTALLSLLTNLPPGSKLELEILPSGAVAVSEDTPKTKADYLAENPKLAAKLAALEGQPIALGEAGEKYSVHGANISRWKDSGFIAVLSDDGYRLYLNEADVMYCVHVYQQRKQSGLGYRGVPLLNDQGAPYPLKHEKLAQRRRAERRQKQTAS